MATAVSADELLVLTVQELRDMLARSFERGHNCPVCRQSNPIRKEHDGKDRA